MGACNANPVAKRRVPNLKRRIPSLKRRIPSLAETLGRVRLATRQVAKDVTLWPLVLPGGEARPTSSEICSLDEALEDGFVAVHPVDGGARLQSRTTVPVWVPAGERVGAAGPAAGSRILPPRGSLVVPCREAALVCRRCARALAAGFHAVDDQVGLVWARDDRAVALELVLPAGLLRRHLARRVEAWAPWLLAEDGRGPGSGFESPEALLEAVRTDRLVGQARVEILSDGEEGPRALTM